MKRTKTGKQNGAPHLVPLPRQAVVVLRELHKLTGKDGDPYAWMFPGERKNGRFMSENTVNAALRVLGVDTRDEQTGHGFRATARTLLAEQLGFDDNVIEAQLAHRVKDSLGRAYNRTQYLEQRRVMLQTWADYLDKLKG
jgi:integrase